MTEKNVVGYQSKGKEFPVFNADIMEEKADAIQPVSPGSAVTPVAPVDITVSSVDSIGLWRLIGERLKRKGVTSGRSGKDFDYKNRKPDNQINSYQQAYGNDSLILSENAGKHHDFFDELIKQIRQSNIDVPTQYLFKPEHEEDHYTDDQSIRVHQVMSKDIVCIIDSTTVRQAASIFNKEKISGLPVIDYSTKRLTGIITMTDILNYTFEEKIISSYHTDGTFFRQDTLALMDEPVKIFMNKNVVNISPDIPVGEACRIMENKGIHRLIVTNEAEKVLGIFSAFDAVKLLANL